MDEQATGGYVGPDRRTSGRQWQASRGRGVVAGTVGLVLAPVLLLAVGRTASIGALAGEIPDLDAATVVASVLLGALGLHVWRLTGQTRMRWCALGAWSLTVAAAASLGDGLGGTPPVLAAGHAGATVVAIGALAFACWSPEVDTRVRLGGTLARWGVTLTVVAGVAGVSAATVGGDGPIGPPGHLVIGGVAAVLGVAAVWTAVRDRHRMTAWIALLLTTTAASELTAALGPGHVGPWATVAATSRLLGCLLATGGVLAVLRTVHARQRGALHTAESIRRRAAASARARREVLVHEARNALTAIEAATIAFERHHARLSAAQRQLLGEGITQEIARLQRLIGVTPDDGAAEPIDLRAIVDRQAALAAARGEVVHVATPPDPVHATADPTEIAEIVQNLLINAARHGSSQTGTDVSVDRDPLAPRVQVRVEDRGPGVPIALAEQVFRRRWQAEPSRPGAGLGLAVSRELARAAGGDLRVEPRPGGGASFVLTLPALAPATLTVARMRTLGGWHDTPAPPAPVPPS